MGARVEHGFAGEVETGRAGAVGYVGAQKSQRSVRNRSCVRIGNLASGHVQSHEVHFCLAELRIHCDGSGTGVACAIVRVPRVVRVHAIRCASGQRIRPPRRSAIANGKSVKAKASGPLRGDLDKSLNCLLEDFLRTVS